MVSVGNGGGSCGHLLECCEALSEGDVEDDDKVKVSVQTRSFAYNSPFTIM